MDNVNIKLKKCCLTCAYCDVVADKAVKRYFTDTEEKCWNITCSHAGVCKSYIDDPGHTINNHLKSKKEEKSEWTPTKKQLPQNDEILLVQITGKTATREFQNALQIGYYDQDQDHWYIDGYEDFVGKVVAWQPLPEEYEEEK